jgi:hypothetical protein
MTDSFDPATDITGNGSIEGQLASSYTNWVAGEVKSAGDFIAYTWYLENGDLTKAIEISNALQSGAFSLDDLFLAANGKTGGVTDIAGVPDPKVVVAGVTIDLSDFFGDATHVTEWNSGNAKNIQYHDREYLTDFNGGTAPDDWQNPTPNQPPTAEAIAIETSETQSVYTHVNDQNVLVDDHTIQNTDADPLSVNLITDANATDPDSDILHIVTNSVTLQGGDPLPDFITVDGDSISIDRNSRLLDYLKADPNDPDHSLTLTLTYQITDGHTDPITNTVTIEIDGTADEYQATGSGSISADYLKSGGNVNNQTLSPTDLPPDGFDFTFTGTVTATETGLTGNESGTVADATPTDWLGGPLDVGKVGGSFAISDAATLTATALDDGSINYNVSFNNTDPTDKVTVTLDYQYDYWYSA